VERRRRDVGYPITFTLRDVVHKIAGARVARALIVAAAAVNLLMAGLFWLVARLPSVPDVGPQTELFGDVLGPVWRIMFASIVAEVLSELIDTEVYRVWVARFGELHRIPQPVLGEHHATALPPRTVHIALRTQDVLHAPDKHAASLRVGATHQGSTRR
jgi:hypothetical protein